ncbi:YdjY domain-containing protein [Neobacillus sp. PS3-40]|uniref:YdjY domain-containing protein n=1 Tax=Neobacillus sp. PS3-40 TaxID=3070679 RepID=UPI0027DFCFD7|nr:YdjY domain-containing protein [Neobacillus sp. PS3-40]WML43884.1 YdjY domain-containing protein [Neobacillus sp. PS3-40]
MKLRNNYFKLFILAIIAVFGLAACSSNTTQPAKKNNKEKVQEVSKDNPIYVDKKNKVVKVYATVNGKYLVTPTRHGLNWVGGAYGDQAVLKAYANPLKFNEALIEIGGVPAVEKGGDTSKEFKITADGGKVIKGDQVKVSITWADAKKVYDINEVMVDSTGKNLDYRFGGNYDTQMAKMTGCYMCFDSCPAGITSNANQPVGTFQSGKAQFHGNAKVLPKDGTPVVLTYSIVK